MDSNSLLPFFLGCLIHEKALKKSTWKHFNIFWNINITQRHPGNTLCLSDYLDTACIFFVDFSVDKAVVRNVIFHLSRRKFYQIRHLWSTLYVHYGVTPPVCFHFPRVCWRCKWRRTWNLAPNGQYHTRASSRHSLKISQFYCKTTLFLFVFLIVTLQKTLNFQLQRVFESLSILN